MRNGHQSEMRFFNTAGPMDTQDHYCIPPLERIDLDYVLNLIHDEKYFILHAPRQTGKTSALIALQDHLNSGAEGDYRCLYVNVEVGQAWRENIPRAMEAILQVLAGRAQTVLGDDSLDGIRRAVLAEGGVGAPLWESLRRWAESDRRPLVLLIDEIDALIGDSLLSVLRQLRSGYDMRPRSFPHSIVLCGVRNVRDYRIHSASEGKAIAGGSGFNISAAALRLGDFDRAETEALLGQHTAETGQEFEPAAIERIYTQTAGQPWLVNALCNGMPASRTRKGGTAAARSARTTSSPPRKSSSRPASCIWISLWTNCRKSVCNGSSSPCSAVPRSGVTPRAIWSTSGTSAWSR